MKMTAADVDYGKIANTFRNIYQCVEIDLQSTNVSSVQ